MTRQRNAGGILRVRGLEIGWVQPLDKWLPVRGFGFNETATFINQTATGEGTNGFVALGVPKKTNNAGIYYENHGVMVRLSQVYQQGSQSSGPGQNGITVTSTGASRMVALAIASPIIDIQVSAFIGR